MNVKQIFNPAINVCFSSSENVRTIKERVYNTDRLPSGSSETQNMEYIGNAQIEEVWKHYYKEYYISNYGYVVKIQEKDKEKSKKLIPAELLNADEKSEGVRWNDFSDDLKQLFRQNSFIPLNRINSGCQVCLNITGNTAEYDIHRLVARFFLEKPIDNDKVTYVIHHIDNNSYNNSVTNLIYLPSQEHSGKHKFYHPMSHDTKK